MQRREVVAHRQDAVAGPQPRFHRRRQRLTAAMQRTLGR